MKKKYNITKEALEELYLVKRLYIKEIAEIYGCTRSNVSKLLLKYDIAERSRTKRKRKEGDPRQTNFLHIDKDELYDLYVNKDYSIKMLAELKYFCSHVTIINRMKEHGIPRREVKRQKGRTNIYVKALRDSLYGE